MPTLPIHRIRRVRISAFIAAAALIAAGCGGDDDAADEPGGSATPDAPTDTRAPTDTDASPETDASTDTDAPTGTDASTDTDAIEPAGDTTGVTDDTIRVSLSGPWSGPLSAIGDQIYKNAYELFQEEVNAAGGIHGRMLEFVKVDNQNTPEGAVAACVEVADNDSFAVISAGSNGSDQCYEDAQIPVFVLGPREFDDSWKYVLGVALLTDLAPTEASFIASDYMNGDEATVGMFTNDDSVGLVEASAGVTGALADLGIEIAHTEVIAAGQTSFVPEVARMKDAGVDLVILNVGTESAGIIRDAAASSYAPQWYVGPSSAIDIIALAMQGALNGVMGTRAVTTVDTPEFQGYVAKVAAAYGDDAAAAANTLDAQSYAQAQIFGHILELAGPDLTRESFLDAALSVDGYETGLLPPFSIAGEYPLIGVKQLFPVQCCGESTGVYEALGPPAAEF